MFGGRSRWDSRLIFLFAAIGSAVGLGNLWRFPYLTYKFGGGAFLIPYLIALFVIGIPLLILEFGLGQRFQKGAIGSLKAVNRRFGGVGFIAIAAGFVVVSYYSVVMAWALVYFIGSFQPSLPWKESTSDFFFNNVLQITDGVNMVGSASIALVIALALVWLAIYFSIFKGVRSVGKVVLITMPLPVILLVVLFLRAITLDGAVTGISYYLKPDFSLLLSSELWLAAIGQVFFTLSLGFGVMIAYASYNKKRQSITRSAVTVALCDMGISLLAGLVVFGVLGYMAQSQGVPIDEVVKSGPSLAFVVFPQALTLLPLAGLFSVLFFLTLLTLGIDSAFSLVEAVNTAIRDARNVATHWVSLAVCSFGFVAGIIFTTGAGLYFLDIIDHFVTNYSLVIAGILECIAVGWFYGAAKLRKFINSVSVMKLGPWWDACITWIVPITLSILVVVQLVKDIRVPYEGYPLLALSVGWVTVAVPIAIGAFMAMRARN